MRNLLVLGLALALLNGCTDAMSNSESPEKAVRPIKLHTVESAAGGLIRTFPAEVKATQRSELSFRVAGELQLLPIQEGHPVKAGQLLARLDPKGYQLVVDQRQAQYRLAKAQFERFSRLLDRKLISIAQYDQHAAELEVAEAALRQAELELKYTEIRAPYAGVVSHRLMENHQSVQAKQPVLVLQSSAQVDLLIQIPESLAAQARSERALDYQPEVLFDADPERVYRARYREMSTETDPQTRSYTLTLTMSVPETLRLYPGMSASVRVDLREVLALDAAAPVVPVAAVFSAEERPLDDPLRQVWLVDPYTMRVSRQPVRVGQLTARGIEVVEGLAEGDVLAAAGVHHLAEGQQVRPWVRERGL